MKFEVSSTPIAKLKADLLVVLLDQELQLGSVEENTLALFLNKLDVDFREKRVKKEYFTRWSDEGIKHLLVFHSSLDTTYNIWEKIKIFASRAMGYGKELNLANITF